MITDYEVIQASGKIADAHGIPNAHLLAMIDVESNGKIVALVNGKPEPYILFEPHKLYARLTEPARSQAVAQKVASKKWDKNLYPKTQSGRWAQIEMARAILSTNGLDPDIAYECASWGVGQVLGEHWNELGFVSVQDFLTKVRSGVEGQIEVMILYCKAYGLLDELQEGRFTALARGYNGPAFKKNNYDTKLANAAKLYGGANAVPDGMLRMGAKGKRVRELQALLVRAGFAIKVDGDFGPETKKKLQAYQEFAKLTPDGVAGPKTMASLGSYLQSADDKPGNQKVHEIKEVIEGAVVAIGGPETIAVAKGSIEAAKVELGQYSGMLGVDWLLSGLGYLSIGLILVGGAYAAYGWWKSKQTKEA